MTSDLSAFYFDIRKDALYCDPYSSPTRKAALTVIDQLFRSTVIWLAPMLCFTTEEAWLARFPARPTSVHLEDFPKSAASWRNDQARREVGDDPQCAARRHRRAGNRTRGQEHRLVAGSLAADLCHR